MLEKLLKLFLHQNPQFEEKRVQEFLHCYLKLEKECGNLTAKLNVSSILMKNLSFLFSSPQGVLQEFQKQLFTSSDEKVKKVELLHNILQTLGLMKPCLDHFYSTPIQKVFYFLRKVPISLALPSMNVVIFV